MLKKILVGGFLLIMIGAVIAGAVTVFAQQEGDTCEGSEDRARGAVARQGSDLQAEPGTGQGRGRGNRESDTQQGNRGEGQKSGRGQGVEAESGTPQNYQGEGRGLGKGQGSGAEPQAEHSDWETIEGVVLETEELVIETSSNEIVQAGLGPSHYRETQGFVLTVGDRVRVSGYWEDSEFKAAQVEKLDTGEGIVLRDTSGRPMWAGQGRGKNRG